jgi:sugar/nucleoside kinase (ribokinase family)
MPMTVISRTSVPDGVTRQGQQMITPSVNIPADQIAGSNGAGDAFAAGALYALHEGWALDRVMALAHAAAAASMRHIGTTDAMMSWSDCLALASKYGTRPDPA